MEEITGFNAQIKKRVVRNKFNQPILTAVKKTTVMPMRPASTMVRPIAMPMRPASTMVRPVAMPMRPASTMVRPVAMPLRPASTIVRPATMPMRPASTMVRPVAMPMRPIAMPIKTEVKTLVPQIIPGNKIFKPLPTKETKIPFVLPEATTKIKPVIIPESKSLKTKKAQTIKKISPMVETSLPSEIVTPTKKPINKTLLIGGGVAALAAFYFLTKKRKK